MQKSKFIQRFFTESMSNGTGSWGVYVKNYKDSLNVPFLTIDLKTYINKNTLFSKIRK